MRFELLVNGTFSRGAGSLPVAAFKPYHKNRDRSAKRIGNKIPAHVYISAMQNKSLTLGLLQCLRQEIGHFSHWIHLAFFLFFAHGREQGFHLESVFYVFLI